MNRHQAINGDLVKIFPFCHLSALCVLGGKQIREIYRRLLAACVGHDFSRHKAQTPLEFLAALETAFPQSAADFRLLTEVYLRVCYGEYPEILDEVHAVDQAWERVQQVLAGER